jgi:tetratricopeptide (TPR) repeat protein
MLPEYRRPKASKGFVFAGALALLTAFGASGLQGQNTPQPIVPPLPAAPDSEQNQAENVEDSSEPAPELGDREMRKLIREGISAYRNEKYDDAATAFRRVLRSRPDSGIANYNNGLVLFRLGLYDKAIEHWQSVIGDLPLMAKTHFNIGNAIVRQAEDTEKTPSMDDSIEQYRKALTEFQKAIELDREDNSARRNFEIIYRRILELENQKEKMAKITEETRSEAMRLISERQYAQAAEFLQEAASEHEFLQKTLSDLIQKSQALAQIFTEEGP